MTNVEQSAVWSLIVHYLLVLINNLGFSLICKNGEMLIKRGNYDANDADAVHVPVPLTKLTTI